MMGADFVVLSLTPILIGAFAAVACALPGNFPGAAQAGADR